MPIYEYRCTKCNNEFEKFQKITDDTVPRCEHCGGKARRLISHSNFHLKGSGWYVTDYGGKKPSSKEQKEEKQPSPSDTSTDTTADSGTSDE